MRVIAVGLLLFVVWVYAEVTLLLYVAKKTNILAALLMTIVTGLIGIALARAQGWQLMMRLRQEFRRGEVPVESLLNGLVLFLAGIFLLIPGLISDLVGIVLLLPPIRILIARRLRAWFERKIQIGRTWIGPLGRGTGSGQGDVVDSYSVPPDQERLPDDNRGGT